MNSHQLQVFLAVAACGSFSKAEKALYISRQALMKQIDKLEEELDMALFNRAPTGLTLTPQGRLFAEGLPPLMRRMEKLVENCRAAAANANHLVIELPVHPTSLLTPLVFRFNRAHPQVALRILRAHSQGRTDRLRAGQIDLAEHPLHPDDDLRGLFFTALVQRPYYCLLSPQHPLAQHPRLRPSDLRESDLYLYNRQVRRELIACLQAREPSLCFNEISGDELTSIMNLCFNGGIYITPALFATQIDSLLAIPLDIPLTQPIGILTRSDPGASAFLFISFAGKHAASLQ